MNKSFLLRLLYSQIFAIQVASLVPTGYNHGSRIIGAPSLQQAHRPVSTVLESSVEEVDASLDTSKKESVEARGREMLVHAIAFNATAASAILTDLEGMRGKTGGPSKKAEEYLNALLASGPDAPLPFWTKSRRMARFSKRARMASLRRALDLTTPPPSESEDGEADTLEKKLQRRRRALVSLLRSIASENESADSLPVIRVIETKAAKDAAEDSSDLRSRLPPGLETPDYEVVGKAGAVEIRRYKPFSVCSVSMKKPRPTGATKEKTDAKVQMPEMNGASSFGALAGYLFGKNDQSTAMKMTTPVFTTPGSEPDDKQMAFVMPSEFWDESSLSTAPKPLEGSGVNLEQKTLEESAVLMFGGYASKKEVEKRKAQLLQRIEKSGDWKVADEESISLAQYNDPFTVPWKRLNEVSVPVVPN